jgi:hypothetical protein
MANSDRSRYSFRSVFFIGGAVSSIFDHVYHEYARNETYAYAQEYFDRKCRLLSTTEELIGCFETAIQSAREPQRAEEDLQTQNRMASWAKWMFIATTLITF